MLGFHCWLLGRGGKGRLRAHTLAAGRARTRTRTRTCQLNTAGWVDWETIRPDQGEGVSSDGDLTYQSGLHLCREKGREQWSVVAGSWTLDLQRSIPTSRNAHANQMPAGWMYYMYLLEFEL
jgi:hypothetical protein